MFFFLDRLLTIYHLVSWKSQKWVLVVCLVFINGALRLFKEHFLIRLHKSPERPLEGWKNLKDGIQFIIRGYGEKEVCGGISEFPLHVW